jgi:hypothetical protein
MSLISLIDSLSAFSWDVLKGFKYGPLFSLKEVSKFFGDGMSSSTSFYAWVIVCSYMLSYFLNSSRGVVDLKSSLWDADLSINVCYV